MNKEKELAIYQAENGSIELRADFEGDTVWATQKQIANVFGIDRTVSTKHINNILKDKEVDDKSNVQKMHIANSDKPVKYYSLDMILAVGYRTNSSTAINFRKWATKTLKKHITEGYTVNESMLKKKEGLYKKVIDDIQKLSQDTIIIKQNDILELVKNFSHTWFSLESFDENNLPQKGKTQSEVITSAKDLHRDVNIFKKELIKKGEATDLFAQEKNSGSLEGIFGNVMQAFGGKS